MAQSRHRIAGLLVLAIIVLSFWLWPASGPLLPGTLQIEAADWVQAPPYRWIIVDPETGEWLQHSAEMQMEVAPGTYDIAWHQEQHRGEPVLMGRVQVASEQTVPVRVDAGVALRVPDGWPAPYRWTLRQGDEDRARFGGNVDPRPAPPGTYRLHWWQSEHGAASVDFGEVTVTSGSLVEVALDSGLELLMPDWYVSDRPYYYSLQDGDGEPVGSWRDLEPQLAPPGAYTLVFRESEHGHSEVPLGPVIVPDSGIVAVSVDSGVRFAAGPDAELPYRVFFLDPSGTELVWAGSSAGSWNPIVLAPGTYRVDWWQNEHATQRFTLHEALEVAVGTLTELAPGH